MQSTSSFQSYPKSTGAALTAHTETTRYLCAAAHVDEKFRHYVMRQIIEEEHRAVGELYGVDIVPIVKWTLAAQQRTLIRNMALLMLLVITIIVFFTSFSLTWLLFFFLCAWIIVMVEAGVSYYGSEARKLTKNMFRPDNIQFTLDQRLEQKLRDISSVQGGNVVVYSGFSPFVGSGVEQGGWSFSVDVSRGKEDNGNVLKPIDFQVREIYGYVTNIIAKLGLGNLIVEDKLYVNGQEIRDDQRFLSHPQARPFTQVSPALVQQFAEKPTQDVRYYKCFRVTSWKGELILSIFVRFVKVGKSLFAEADYQLLPPLKDTYYQIDTTEPTLTARKVGALAKKTFFPSIGHWLSSPAQVFSAVFHNWSLMRERQRVERQIQDNPAFDYGAVSSLREFASSTVYRRYFQKLDREMYVKTIQSQLLESITNFLDQKNVDTSDLKQTQQTVQNSNVIISGGTFQAGNMALGAQAQANTFSTIAGAVRGAVQGGGATGGGPQSAKS